MEANRTRLPVVHGGAILNSYPTYPRVLHPLYAQCEAYIRMKKGKIENE
jgi:hypothetical protein